MRRGIKQVIVGAALALTLSCNEARQLVAPIDNTPIETSGNADFDITIKPVGAGYETTIRVTSITIYDKDGNVLPPIAVEPIIVTTPEADEVVPQSKTGVFVGGNWLSDVNTKTDNLEPDWHCDNHTEFIEDDWSVPNFHHHSIYHSHSHNYWTSGHTHYEGEKIEHANSILEAESNEEHNHVIFIKHSHKHEPFNPPKPFHTHKCE